LQDHHLVQSLLNIFVAREFLQNQLVLPEKTDELEMLGRSGLIGTL
jgi:hypothetical protein